MNTSTPSPAGAAWAKPLDSLDRAMTAMETRIAVVAIVLEMLSMSLWVILKGLSTPPENESHGGVVIRAVIGAVVLGAGLHMAFARRSPVARRRAALTGVAVGLVVARAWAGVGVDYTSNVLNWLQQASFLTLIGGLRGAGTRLTLLLALVGGSLATARGKHIVIDVTARLAKGRTKKVFVLTTWLASAAVCLSASWGFFDHVAIENFGAPAGTTAGAKARAVARGLGEDAFIARAQLAFDLKSFPHVVFRAQPYAEWLRGPEWNAFLVEAGLVNRYGRAATDALRIPDAESRAPLVSIPGRGEPRGELINAANLVFPIGLFIMTLRFVLRALLVLSGRVAVEPDEDAHREGAVAPRITSEA